MDTANRYFVAQSRMAERHAEAARSRLAKGDRFDDRSDAMSPTAVRVAAHQVGASRPSILGRIARLRLRLGGNVRVAAAVTR